MASTTSLAGYKETLDGREIAAGRKQDHAGVEVSPEASAEVT